MKIKLSKKQWELIGKKAQWIPRDPMDISDEDLGPILTPDEEEEILLGKEEEPGPYDAYQDGYTKGGEGTKFKNVNINPYGLDTDYGRASFDQWEEGFSDAQNGKPNKHATANTKGAMKKIALYGDNPDGHEEIENRIRHDNFNELRFREKALDPFFKAIGAKINNAAMLLEVLKVANSIETRSDMTDILKGVNDLKRAIRAMR